MLQFGMSFLELSRKQSIFFMNHVMYLLAVWSDECVHIVFVLKVQFAHNLTQ